MRKLAQGGRRGESEKSCRYPPHVCAYALAGTDLEKFRIEVALGCAIGHTASVTNSEDLISSAEAAQILGVHRATFNRRVVAGLIIPAVSIPGPTGARLFHRSDIEAFAAETAGAAA